MKISYLNIILNEEDILHLTKGKSIIIEGDSRINEINLKVGK